MSNLNEKKETTSAQNTHEDVSLKGTFVFVMSLGVLIVLSWVSVWALFVSRM